MRRQSAQRSASLRFLALVAAMVVVFGSCGSLALGAFDKEQTQSQAPLFNLTTLLHFNLHFFTDFVGVLTTYTDHAGAPFHNYFLFGVGTTIAFCFLSMPLALFIGFVLALMSRSPWRILRVPARTYVEFFRNTPLIVQLLAIYTSLLFLPNWFLNAFTAGIATLVLNYSAYECENLRAGIAALDRGQGEAAAVLGLSYWKSLRLIIVPQMIPVVLPPVINDMIYMYKDSAVLSLIGVLELTVQANRISRRFGYLSWQFFLVTALIYLLLSLPLGRLARRVEARLRSSALAPKRDLTQMAVAVLLGAMALGWACDVLTLGLSVSSVFVALGQLLVAIALSIALILFIFCTLGLVVYLVGTFTALAGRRSNPPVEQADASLLAAVSK
ncbi:MAG: amino acid ABC transporter permease [Ktedonobacterales bacterium]